MSIGNGKNEKKRISILDWSLKKMKYVTKIFIFKFWNFHFWNLKWKFLFNFLKKLVIYHQREMKKQLKWSNHIFLLCHRDKTSNNTPIPPISPMYITLYHMCKLWWYTINLWITIFLHITWCSYKVQQQALLVEYVVSSNSRHALYRLWGQW
jgi:hypothetical protein